MARPGYDSPAGSAPSARPLPQGRRAGQWCPTCHAVAHAVICPVCYQDVVPAWVTIEARGEWEGR